MQMRNPVILALVFGATGALWWATADRTSTGSRQADQGPGAVLAAVTVPEMQGDAALGEAVFNANCASCHGENAAGQDGVAPPLVHKFYGPKLHGDGAFLIAALNGVRAHHWKFGSMPPVPDVSNGDIKLVTNYIRTLQRANGIN